MGEILNITEQEYRDLGYCSFSTLSALDSRDNNVREKRSDSPALSFGSLVDCVALTPEEFEDKFCLVKEAPTASTKELADKLIELDFEITNVGDQEEQILDIITDLNLWSRQTDKLKLKKLTPTTVEYVNHSIANRNKMPVTQEDLEKASMAQSTLHTHFLTNHIFHAEEYGNETLFQVKGVSEINSVPFKFMCDIVYIDHENKVIYVYDLKTGSSIITKFEKSIIDYRYDIQHYLYTLGINDIKEYLVKDGDKYTVQPLSFIYFDKGNLEVPVIYHIPDKYDIYNGYKTMYGRNMRGIKELLELYTFYENNGYLFPKRWVENDGELIAEL